MRLSYETKAAKHAAKHAAIAIDCWHTIDSGWDSYDRAAGTPSNYDSHGLLGSVSMVFMISAQARPKQAMHDTSKMI